ncbi:MAG: hypothetical protein LBV74_16355 [Tannerella sp.]|jgi:hypothetical protein|nr:hypothetical protein [Tannerella sp.]
MNFAAHYFTRYKSLPPFFREKPDEGLEIIVIIPCLDDEFIFHTLDSLERTDTVPVGIEVIVNVNSGEKTPPEVVERNRLIFDGLKQKAETGFYKKFRLIPLLVESTEKKKSGVGFARKTAMDEAVRRFASIDKPEGLIVSLDADSLVAKSYFQEITKAMDNRSAECFTFQFQHYYDRSVYPENVITACRLYEIYLRYYRLALKTFQFRQSFSRNGGSNLNVASARQLNENVDFPFAIHTIGSCFAIRAEAYTKLGGMPPRQGGEDFYFLQKAVKMHPVYEVREPIVFPSPRVSDRVPFGTGPSVRNILEKGEYLVYNFELFSLLKAFYGLFPAMEHEEVKERIPSVILDYIGADTFDAILSECRKYSSSSKAFVKRMYDNFDAFFIVKFLNTFNDSGIYPLIDVMDAGRILLNYYGIKASDDVYERLMLLDISS